MRNKLLCTLVVLFTAFSGHQSVFAQREADCTINGNCWQIPGLSCSTPSANMILKFNEDSLESIIEPLDLGLATNYSRAAFSDKHTGELIFASNGYRLVNRSGQVLAYKLWRDEVPWPGDNPDTSMVLNSLGPLFLNDPGDSTKAYLLYGQYIVGSITADPDVIKADQYFT